MNPEDIIKRAQKKAGQLKKLKVDPRVTHVLGKYKSEGWIQAPGIKEVQGGVYLDDVLWVGENVEPRVLELLPAILLKKPRTIHFKELPEDLRDAINQLKKNKLTGNFRGIPLTDCYQWISYVGRKNKYPTITMSYRFKKSDYELLNQLSKKLKKTKSAVIREALHQYSQSLSIG